jgi:hypothetical protein
MLTPAVAWLWLNRGCLRSVHRRLLLVAVALIPISLAYGTPSELREYLMPLTMLAYLAVALEGERTRRLAPPVGVVYAEPVRDPVEV